MALKDDLIAARALISEPELWGKGPDGAHPPSDGTLCAMNACCQATRHDYPLMEALAAQLPQGEWDCAGLPVAAYNDDPATTHNDILALFDRAINACEPAP